MFSYFSSLYYRERGPHNLQRALKETLQIFPKRRLLGQRTKSAGTPFHVHSLLFADDGAFLFQTHDESEKAWQIIHDHSSRFGLQMYVGSDESKSKTKAMYSPLLKDALAQDTPIKSHRKQRSQ